jgi:hypothetical protein
MKGVLYIKQIPDDREGVDAIQFELVTEIEERIQEAKGIASQIGTLASNLMQLKAGGLTEDSGNELPPEIQALLEQAIKDQTQ